MRFLRTNTAVRITVGPFLDHADGVTPLDTMTVTDIACILTYDADDNDAVSHAHLTLSASAGDNDIVTAGGGGMWDLELTAANVNILGRMMLCFTDADQICPVFHEFTVLTANVYDSLFGGHGVTADLLDVNQAQYLGTAAHAASEAGTPCVEVVRWAGQDVHATTVNGIPVVQLHDSAGAGGINAPANFEDLSIADTTGLVAVPTTQKVDLETIKTQAVTCAAGVTVLASVGAPAAPGANGGLPTTNGTKLNQTVDLTAGQSIACSDKTGFSLSATGADLILKTSTFVQAIVAAVNELATYGLTALNTLLTSTGIKAATVPAVTLANGAHGGAATVITLQTPIEANVASETDHDFTATQKTSLNSATPASVQNIPVDGTFKVDLEHIKTRDVTCGAAVTIRADVGHAAAPGAENGAPYVAAGGAKLSQTVDLTAGQKIAATLATADVTGNLPADAKAWNGGALPTVGDATAAELAKVPKSDSNVTFNATALGDINAQVVDALGTDTYAEPGQGAPAATTSLAAKIGYLFKAWRNRHTQDGSDYKLYADNKLTVDQKASVSDDGTTFDRDEVGTGA